MPHTQIRTSLSCLFALILCLLPYAQGQAPKLKVATVDIQKLFKEYYRTNEEQQKFNTIANRIQKEGTERLAVIQKLEEELRVTQKKIEDPTLSDEAKFKESRNVQLKLDELKAMIHEHKQFMDRRLRTLKLKEATSKASILKEIHKHVRDYSKIKGFDFVVDKSGISSNQVSILLYTKDASDITAAILRELNKETAKDSTLPINPSQSSTNN